MIPAATSASTAASSSGSVSWPPQRARNASQAPAKHFFFSHISCPNFSKNLSRHRDNLQKCRIQGKYAGKVTDVHKGVVYVRLANGVNAVAHSCYDYRMPGKKDDVSFAVTHLDVERGIALGIITRIIRQNL